MLNIKSYPQHGKFLFELNKTGRIHSVFDNTINVVVDDCLFALSHRELVNTPMSIQLDVSAIEFQKMIFEVNEEVYFNPLGIKSMRYFFNKSHALMNDELIKPFSYEQDYEKSLFHLKRNIYEILISDQIQGEMVHAWMKLHGLKNQPLFMMGDYFLRQFRDIQHATSIKNKLDIIVGLVGAGEGLTPSGDDFVTGVLAILHYLHLNETNHKFLNELVNRLKLRTKTTTLVSEEYLKLAITGRFNDYVYLMLDNHQTNKPIYDELQKISTIGHSSGTDFLVGMYFGLEIGGI